jgi:hypothetical protein
MISNKNFGVVGGLGLLLMLDCAGKVSLDDRPCPCAAGFECCAAADVCVPSPAPASCVGNQGTPNPSSPSQSGGATSNGGVAGASRVGVGLESTGYGGLAPAPGGALGGGGAAGSMIEPSVGDAGAADAAGEAGEAGAAGAESGPAHDYWLAMSSGPLTARYDHTAVWAGDSLGNGQLVIWGGRDQATNPGQGMNSGARYFPRDDHWEIVSATNAPTPRFAASAVWTGSRVLVWGGSNSVDDPGGSYDPVADSWESIPGCPFGVESMGAFATWTGTKMLVFESGRGAIYDPVQRTWTQMSPVGAPDALYGSAVWTGDVWIIWGGQAAPDQVFAHSSLGAKYDPNTDTWSATSIVGAPSAREAQNAVWTGTRMLVWGGLAPSGTDESSTPIVPSDAALYDPVTNVWQPLSNTLVVSEPPLFGAVAVRTPAAILLWGLHANDMSLPASGGRLNLQALAWSPLSQMNEPEQRLGEVGVWTGLEMLVWGGYNGPVALPSGGRYFP